MKIALVYGTSGSGKTTAVTRCFAQAQNRGWRVGGIVAPGSFHDNCRQEFWVVDLASGQQQLLARRGLAAPVYCGPFGFSAAGLEFGRAAIRRAISDAVDLLIIDEIGPLELRNMGWAEVLREILPGKVGHLLLTVRPALCQEVSQKFFAQNAVDWFPVAETESLWQELNVL